MGYLIFRGVSTQDLPNVVVQTMPSHKKAAKRMTDWYIKGRDGVLHTDEGFDNVDIQCRLMMLNAPAETRQIINAWADGTGKLISSDDLSRCWNATVKDEIDFYRVEAATVKPETFNITKPYYVNDYVTYSGMVYKFIQNHAAGAWNSAQVKAQPWKIDGLYDVADVTFNCQPFMRESVESVVEITQNVEGWANQGTADAYPLIKVEGNDTEAIAFDFCGEYIIIRNINPNDPVFIDCETGYIYTENNQPMSMEGNFPIIHLGTNGVYFNPEHPPTKLTVTPRWRWV